VVHRRGTPCVISSCNIVPGLLAIVLSMTLVLMSVRGSLLEGQDIAGAWPSLVALIAGH